MLPPGYSPAPHLNMNFQPPTEAPGNKYMYVKQGFLNSIQQRSHPKVLINPNFMHVKPHINKQFLVNQTIHVNPNILKRNVQTEVRVGKPVPNKAIVTTATKLIRVPQAKASNANNNVIVSTRMKLVRVAKNEAQNSRIRRTSIHTQYKIIRHPSAAKMVAKKETDIKKLYYVKNRFRIDHRSLTKPVSSHKLIRSLLNTRLTTKNVYIKYNSKLNKARYVSINGILYRRSPKSLVNVSKKTETNKATVRRKEQLLTIRGQKYKLDSNHRTLTLLSRTDSKVTPNFKTIYVGGLSFKQKGPNVFVKSNATQKHILLSQAKQRSINTLTNKMRKSNVPCLFYHRFGKCRGKESGTCIRIHNPDQVSLCPKYVHLYNDQQNVCNIWRTFVFIEFSKNCSYASCNLKIDLEGSRDFRFGGKFKNILWNGEKPPYLSKCQRKCSKFNFVVCNQFNPTPERAKGYRKKKKFLQGACVNDKCLLSHKVSAEKMPTCRFFLDGLCSKDDCPYLHVKINAKADICKDFLEGFCSKAAECDKRHQYLCPDFEKNGKCMKRKCPYPHGNVASNKVGKVNIKNHPVSTKNNKSNSGADLKGPGPEKAANVRYYAESTPGAMKEVLDTAKECADIEIVDLDVEQNDSGLVSPVKKRPTVGDLPSFIPFLDENQNL